MARPRLGAVDRGWKPLPHKPGWSRRQGGLRRKAHRSLYLPSPIERLPRLSAEIRPEAWPLSPLSRARSRPGVTPLQSRPPCHTPPIRGWKPLPRENSTSPWKPLPHKPGWSHRQGGLRRKAHRSLYLPSPREKAPQAFRRNPPGGLAAVSTIEGAITPWRDAFAEQTSLSHATYSRLEAAPTRK